MDIPFFESILDRAIIVLTKELASCANKPGSQKFENRVREVLSEVLSENGVEIDMAPPAQEFPDIVIGQYGIEVKYSEKDTWRSIANSVFEGRRNESVKHVYLLFGKAGGIPEVKWNKYENSIMHVRTSHVPRFEVEIGTEKPLFERMGIPYEAFRILPQHEKMLFIREYARSRMKPGERLWWIEDSDEPHTFSLEVKLYTKLSGEEKLKYRAEAALLCPQIVKGSRARGKYDDATMYLLTFHGILCNQARDLFTAGSVAMRSDQTRGGNYMLRALQDIEPQIEAAANYLGSRLFVEYWGDDVPKNLRIKKWLEMLDEHASDWVPSQELFN
ncbi:MAG: hypothetical protein COB30_003720 [Ectothiorhodospiraceae bacterium]|nr:hypothetical protein [Ectothiorhodospiraceae bacterium]